MIENYQADLESLLRHWGLTAFSWEKVKDVYRVHTNYGIKNLKVSPLKRERLLFVHRAIAHLLNNGFCRMYPYIPASEGQTYITDGFYAYTLFDWIEGRQCDFKNQSELIRSTQIFAEFHQKTYGFHPPAGSNMRNQLGKCIKHFRERFQDLQNFKEIAAGRPDDPFAVLYMENVGFYMQMAAEAIARLERTAYQQLVETACLTKPFCHGDPAARNFILTPDNQIYMIDFDSCRLDLPLMDLIKFIRRIMKKYRWNFEFTRLALESYNTVHPLNETELEVMKAVLYFPQKFWRMAIRYFHDHGRHTPERSLRKFEKYLQNQAAFAHFQSDFDQYRTTGVNR